MNDHNGLTNGNEGSTYGPVWSPVCQRPTSLGGPACLETLDGRLWRFTVTKDLSLIFSILGKIITLLGQDYHFYGKVSLGVIISILGHDYLKHIMRVMVVVMMMMVVVVVLVVVVAVIITMVKTPTSPAPRGSPGTSSGTSHQPCLTSERQGSAAKIDLLNFHNFLNSYHMKNLSFSHIA